MEEYDDFSLCGKAAVTEANLRDEYYWKLVADFIGAQSGEELELLSAPCKNRVLIQVGLLREDNNFPWVAIVDWLKKILPSHQTADFRRLIERGIATTLSLGSNARFTFLESDVNFSFVGPICDSIGVEREHLLEMRDFSEQAQWIEVTNGLILELSNFTAREEIAPVAIVPWLRNFEPEFCKKGNFRSAYSLLRGRIRRLKKQCRNTVTRRIRRNAAMENLLQSPFELVQQKTPKIVVKKRMRKDFHSVMGEMEDEGYFNTSIAEENVSDSGESDEDLEAAESEEETIDEREEVRTLLDLTMLSIRKLLRTYNGKMKTCKQNSYDLLKEQYSQICREHRAVAQFDKTIASAPAEMKLASPVVFLNDNACFLVALQDAVEQQIMSFEKEIMSSTGDKLGRDKLPKFRNFINTSESATSRYIHMVCDILSPRSPDTENYRKHWIAFCREKRNPSKILMSQSNQCIRSFEAAAGLIHHHKEIALFFSDLLSLDDDKSPNVILESVATDANDSVIQSLVCVLAIIYCKILGPYKQLLASDAPYALFSQYILWLYQRFLDWCKNPATLLEPEEAKNAFQQAPVHEKTYDGIFHYCGQWHTNREMIRVCLKRIVKTIATVTEEHLSVFLPGGMHAQIPSPHALVKGSFYVLMAEYVFSEESPQKKMKTEETFEHHSSKDLSSGYSQGDYRSDNSDYSDDETSNWEARKKDVVKMEDWEPQVEENMDRDYIIATVTNNGGPCRTQQDLEKMMLRFDGKSRIEKREGIRCEMLYHKMILNNPDPNLDCYTKNCTNMVLKLKMVLPRVKPGYSLVLAPRKTKPKPVLKDTMAVEVDQSGSSHTETA